MADSLEWNERTHYALTELILFLLTSLVVALGIGTSFVVSYIHLKSGVSFFSTLRPLFENVLPSAIAFTPAHCSKADMKKCKPKGLVVRVDVVFLGHQERAAADGGKSSTRRRIWVHVYFILLCCLIILWAISVFSDTILYRKTSSCTDISLADTDLSCFLLSKRDIPKGVQEIIDEEEGQLVPCDRVQNYIIQQNITFDLEVICYQYQLNPLAALGITYGAMKSIAFIIVSVLSVILTFTNKLNHRNHEIHDHHNTEDKALKPISTSKIVISHIVLLVISIILIVILAIVAAVIHEVAGTRNSGFDFLRGEMFYPYSVVVLAPITIIYTICLFPWWAFEKLSEPTDWDFKGSEQELKKKMYRLVHSVLLHQKFSTGFTALLEILTANVLNAADENIHDEDKEESPEDTTVGVADRAPATIIVNGASDP